MYLNIIMKEKKAVLLLIPDDISIEEQLAKTKTVIANFYNDKKDRKKKYC